MTDKYEPQAQFLKALAHPMRLAILNILRNSEECVCHIEAALGRRQAYISQHLMLLREAGLIQDRRDGWNIYYRVAKQEVFGLIDQTSGMVGVDAPPAGENLSPRKSVPNCPCPKCSPGSNCGSPVKG